MRNFIACLVIALLLYPSSGHTQNFTGMAQNYQSFSEQDKSQYEATLKKLDRHIKNLTSIKSKFRQIHSAEAYISKGTFYMQRPGKVRMDYISPDPLELYITGSRLVLYDKYLNQVSYGSTDALWRALLSDDSLSLMDDAIALLSLKENADNIAITIIEKDRLKDDVASDRVTIVFDKDPIRLTRFYWSDDNNATTTVSLINPRYNIELDESLFDFKNPRLFKGNRR